MKQHSFHRILRAAAIAALPTFAGVAWAAEDQKLATYEVTITNLTTGQPLSPPVVAAHDGKTHMWQKGEMASAWSPRAGRSIRSSPS